MADNYVLPGFIAALNDIGRLGEQKYKENCFHARCKRGDKSRSERLQSAEVIDHIKRHAEEYLLGIKHDHFKTLKHQLAAAAFNAMMEFYYLNEEETK